MARVIIDAGHGGYDNGATYLDKKEKTDTLNLALAVGNILENNGVDVIYTRATDIYQSPTEKAQIANQAGGDVFVSLHRNSGSMPNLYSGVQTLVYDDAGLPHTLAENINMQLEKIGFKNLGIEERKNLAVLRRTKMPAVLVEAGFLNTDQDNKLFDLKFPEVAQAIADGILESINKDKVAAKEIVGLSVETGLFRHYENAQGLQKNMEEDGFEAVIAIHAPYYAVRYGDFEDREQAEQIQKVLAEAGYETRIIET